MEKVINTASFKFNSVKLNYILTEYTRKWQRNKGRALPHCPKSRVTVISENSVPSDGMLCNVGSKHNRIAKKMGGQSRA